MKKQLLITGLVAMASTAAFAQGTLNFKTTGTKDPVLYSTDGTTVAGSLTSSLSVPTYGNVSFGIISAVNGTTPLTTAQLNAYIGSGAALPSGWTEQTLSGITGTGSGVVSSAAAVTISANSGAAGNPVELAVIAWTGTLGASLDYGYSGNQFNGNPTVTFSSTTYNEGVTGFSQVTGNPPTVPTPSLTYNGNTAMGAIVLTPVPEPTTIALGGLGAAALLLFRRRK